MMTARPDQFIRSRPRLAADRAALWVYLQSR
jgi:hypothetical protein